MPKDLHFLAGEIRESLENDAVQGAAELVEFAMEHSRNNKTIHRVLLTKMKLSAATEPEKEELLTEMRDLIEKILEEDTSSGLPALTSSEALPAPLRSGNHLVCHAEGLWKTFKKSGFSIKHVSLHLRLGEITGLVGENGNGKTTVFRLITGDLAPDSGQLSYPYLEETLGFPNITWDEIKKHIAFIPQDLPKWQGSVRDNLHYELAIHGIKGKENIDEVEYILHRLGLEKHQDKTWNQLSGGYKLRFALARALAWKPIMLVIDEPLANLDIKAQLIILNDLRDLANSFRYPLSIVISSQHLHEIENVSDRILFLREGAPVFYGKVEDLGNERLDNSFEFAAALSLEELEKRLKNLSYYKLEHNGLSFLIHTPLSTSQKEVLSALIEANVELEYFRDISKSTKKLFV